MIEPEVYKLKHAFKSKFIINFDLCQLFKLSDILDILKVIIDDQSIDNSDIAYTNVLN